MPKFKIESDIPMPTRGRRTDWPELEVGQSFVVKDVKQARAYRTWSKNHGIEMAERKVSNGYRLWRTS